MMRPGDISLCHLDGLTMAQCVARYNQEQGEITFVMVLALVALIVGAVLWLVPTYIAYRGKHPQRLAIMLLNVLLGWTLIGWVGALVWSVTKSSLKEA